ncbi:MAG: hypothetical protein GX220_06275 [Treponema sp.]|nr:hypothetical protein [Treponema sp.]
MKRIFFALIILSLVFGTSFAQSKNVSNPLYPSSRQPPQKEENIQKQNLMKTPEHLIAQKTTLQFPLIGTDVGLFRITDEGSYLLWDGASVLKIIMSPEGHFPQYYFLTSKGVFTSNDLVTFSEKNSGLPFLTIKEYDGEKKSFVKQIQSLKDLEMHPENPNILVTTTRSEVFLTRDGGESWQNLGFSSQTMGAKAVAVATLQKPGVNLQEIETAAGKEIYNDETKELVVFLSHSLYGLGYIKPDTKNPQWTDIREGFFTEKTMSFPDEISDIVPVVEQDVFGNKKIEIYLSQTFSKRLYRLNWEHLCGEEIFRSDEKNGTFDGLAPMSVDNGTLLYFTRNDGFSRFDTRTKEMIEIPAIAYVWNKYIDKADYYPQCALFFSGMTGAGAKTHLSLSELWLLRFDSLNTLYSTSIDGIKSLYVPTHQAINKTRFAEHMKTIKDNKLNSIVVDMKNDFGVLHYDSKDEKILEKATISKYCLELESFVKEMKEENIYLIARIVVFKDKNLSNYDKGKYAVVDAKGKTWQGIRTYNDDDTIEYYDENWVDPYSEEVWEYNIRIAKELITRGFDEIQFDYIRFPTDGKNLHQARYRWQDKDMDKESALVSFLSYARNNIDAPIAIDIYGANGWYRSGTRTGQDVELMSKYVDIICPMFYPNHFEQSFLAHEPAIERPYRIYYYGTYRNAVIARNQVLVRPWVQAFYMNVSYDRQYYDKNYVRREIFGVRDSKNNGYMYWNNSGRYADISVDPSVEETYPWK